jgi:hypothetical protein
MSLGGRGGVLRAPGHSLRGKWGLLPAMSRFKNEIPDLFFICSRDFGRFLLAAHKAALFHARSQS